MTAKTNDAYFTSGKNNLNMRAGIPFASRWSLGLRHARRTGSVGSLARGGRRSAWHGIWLPRHRPEQRLPVDLRVGTGFLYSPHLLVGRVPLQEPPSACCILHRRALLLPSPLREEAHGVRPEVEEPHDRSMVPLSNHDRHVILQLPRHHAAACGGPRMVPLRHRSAARTLSLSCCSLRLRERR